MKIFLIDTSVVAHLINARLQGYSLSLQERQQWIAASFLWVNALGLMPYFADSEQCRCIWLLDSKVDGQYWRSHYCPEYKANRTPTNGIDEVMQVFRSLDLSTFEEPGYEADDLAALFCVLFRKRDVRSKWRHTYLLTIDTDWQGLIGDGITWVDCNGHTPHVRDIPTVYDWLMGKWSKQPKKWQRIWPLPSAEAFHPTDIWDWKVHVGDRSDNLLPKHTPHPEYLINLYAPHPDHTLWSQPEIVSRAEAVVSEIKEPPMSARDATSFLQSLGTEPPLSYIVY